MKYQKKQSGAILVIGLIILMILSVIVITSSKTTLLQQKMSSNLKDRELAFQAAETAISIGENLIRNKTKTELKAIIFDGSNGFYGYDADRALKEESDWENLNTLDSDQSLHQVTGTQEYIIENIEGVRPPGGSLQAPIPIDSFYYRISSKSKGGTADSLVVLQSIYKK